MQVYSPDVDARHLAPLTATGPFAAISEACLRGPAAALRSGRLVGYTGWLNGCCPEQVRFVDGEIQPDPYRPWSRGHYALPWLAVCAGGNLPYTNNLEYALCEHTDSIIRCDMNGVEFAHKGDGPGWPGSRAGESGRCGHWAHAENFLQLWLWRQDMYARDLWRAWVSATRNDFQRLLAGGANRESHTHFQRLWLAWKWNSDATAKGQAEQLAAMLIATPLELHSEGYFDPTWVYSLWQCFLETHQGSLWFSGSTAREWFLQADDDCWRWAAMQPLCLAATAYWIDGNADRLRRHLPVLAAFPYRYFRTGPSDLHLEHGWLGLGIAERGDSSIPNQWPIFLRALSDAGITALPPLTSGGYPITDEGGTVIVGLNVGRGIVRVRSWGAAAHSTTLTIHEGTPAQKSLRLDPPPDAREYESPYDFGEVATAVRVQVDGQLLAPLSASPDEKALIEAGKTYGLSSGCGFFVGDGGVANALHCQCVQSHVTLYDSVGAVLYGLFAGRGPEYVVPVPLITKISKALVKLDARCESSVWTTLPGRLAFRADGPGTWKPSVPTVKV